MKVGDKVRVKDNSYSFGIYNGEFTCHGVPYKIDLLIVKTNLFVMEQANGDTTGEYRKQNDLLVTDEEGNFWFVQSRFCRLVDKKIEVKYFCNGKDVTDNISDETKRNLTT